MTLKVGSEVTQGYRNRHVSIRQYSTIVIIVLSMFQAGIVVRPKLFQFGATSLRRRQSQCDIPHWVMWRGATVTANNRHRWSMTYDFLLTFHSKKGLSSTVSEINGDFSRKSQKNSTPCILCLRWRGSPWYWVLALRVKKHNDGATGPRKKFDDIFSRLDTIHQRDRQTDRQKPISMKTKKNRHWSILGQE